MALIAIRVAEELKSQLVAEARQSGVDLSSYCRAKLLAGGFQERVLDELRVIAERLDALEAEVE